MFLEHADAGRVLGQLGIRSAGFHQCPHLALVRSGRLITVPLSLAVSFLRLFIAGDFCDFRLGKQAVWGMLVYLTWVSKRQIA